MRSAPTLKIWMTPFASVAMLEKLALLKIAFCKAPAFSRTSSRRTSVTISTATGSPSRIAVCSIFVPFLICDWRCLVFSLAAIGARERRSALALASPGLLRDASSAQVMLETGEHFRQDDRLGQKGIPPDLPTTRLNFSFRDGRRQKHNRHGFQLGIRLKTSGQFPAVHTRHHHIQQD